MPKQNYGYRKYLQEQAKKKKHEEKIKRKLEKRMIKKQEEGVPEQPASGQE